MHRAITRIAQLVSFGMSKAEARAECTNLTDKVFEWAYRAATYDHNAPSKVPLSSCAGLTRASCIITKDCRITFSTYKPQKG